MKEALTNQPLEVMSCLVNSKAFHRNSQEQLDKYMTIALTMPDSH